MKIDIYTGKNHAILPAHLAIEGGPFLDVVVGSPPYNVGAKYDGYYDSMSDLTYLDALGRSFREIHRALKPSGSFFLNLGFPPSKGNLHYAVVEEVRRCFHVQNRIVWLKAVTIHQRSFGHFQPLSGSRRLNSLFEDVLHLTHTEDVKLDRLAIGVPYADPTNTTRWKHGRALHCRGNVWFIPYKTVRKHRATPAEFPPELPWHCIQLHGGTGLTVCDPWVGGGNSLKACLSPPLIVDRFIGIDVSPVYTARVRELAKQMEDEE